MNELPESELSRRAAITREQFEGIVPQHEAFYIQGILYSAHCAADAFQRYDVCRSLQDTDAAQVSAIHEALEHCAALSRFFWPSKMGARARKGISQLREARASRLRDAFSLSDDSPLRNRRLRDALEHFDERLDTYLLQHDGGYFFPSPMINDSTLADEDDGHFFKMLDPSRSEFVCLGEVHSFEGLPGEIKRIAEMAGYMADNGDRLSSWPGKRPQDPAT